VKRIDRELARQTPSAMALGHRVRDGETPREVADTGETYDLVVVGAGLAGLCAAYLYHQRRRPELYTTRKNYLPDANSTP
jgi:spermidine dehydrogenase